MPKKNKTIIHAIFGELEEVETELWTRKESIKLFGKSHKVDLYIDMEDETKPQKTVLNAYKQYTDQWMEISKKAEEALLAYYQAECEMYRDQMDIEDPNDANVPIISTTKELAKLVTPIGLTFPDIYRKPTFGVLFNCTWEIEHGAAVAIKDGRIDEVGFQDIIL